MRVAVKKNHFWRLQQNPAVRLLAVTTVRCMYYNMKSFQQLEVLKTQSRIIQKTCNFLVVLLHGY